MELVTQVITISAASTAKTAKIQFHQYFVTWSQRYISIMEKPVILTIFAGIGTPIPRKPR
jgi:hypothetical protein